MQPAETRTVRVSLAAECYLHGDAQPITLLGRRSTTRRNQLLGGFASFSLRRFPDPRNAIPDLSAFSSDYDTSKTFSNSGARFAVFREQRSFSLERHSENAIGRKPAARRIPPH